jgi:hypothetical protein
LPQRCSICASDRIADINKALLVQGRSLRDVSQAFCIAFASLARHSRNCIGRRFAEGRPTPRPRGIKAPTPPPASSRISEPVNAEGQITEMIGDVRAIMDAARDSGDVRLQILAGRELRPLIETWSKLKVQARTGDDDRRRLGLEVWAAMPEEFLRRLRDGDPTLLAHIENAVSLGEDGVNEGESKPTAADG